MKKLLKEEHYLKRSEYCLCDPSMLDTIERIFANACSPKKVLKAVLVAPIMVARSVIRLSLSVLEHFSQKGCKKRTWSATEGEMRVYSFKKQVPYNNIPFEYLNEDFKKSQTLEENRACIFLRDNFLINGFTLEYTKCELNEDEVRICFTNKELHKPLALVYSQFKLGYFSEELSYLVTTKAFLNDLPVALERTFLNKVELIERNTLSS